MISRAGSRRRSMNEWSTLSPYLCSCSLPMPLKHPIPIQAQHCSIFQPQKRVCSPQRSVRHTSWFLRWSDAPRRVVMRSWGRSPPCGGSGAPAPAARRGRRSPRRKGPAPRARPRGPSPAARCRAAPGPPPPRRPWARGPGSPRRRRSPPWIRMSTRRWLRGICAVRTSGPKGPSTRSLGTRWWRGFAQLASLVTDKIGACSR
mmetsp:Transcript_91949/g.268887  ORF Transcript_91949/g.268887 Transcript_91949/m.268887 type:complete len:203 (-) Transcript_91949:1018-1626(-)